MKKKSTTTTAITKAPDLTREITGWILAGHSEADITEALAAKYPNAQAKPAIVAAMSALAEAGEPDERVIVGFALESSREILRRCLDVGDHSGALAAVKLIHSIGTRRAKS